TGPTAAPARSRRSPTGWCVGCRSCVLLVRQSGEMGEQARLFKRHRVVAACAPGAAAHDAPGCEIRARDGAVPLQRLDRVAGAAWVEAAAGAEPRADGQLPAAHQGDERAAHHATACAKSCSSSARTARLSMGDVALVNCARSNAARSRTM